MTKSRFVLSKNRCLCFLTDRSSKTRRPIGTQRYPFGGQSKAYNLPYHIISWLIRLPPRPIGFERTEYFSQHIQTRVAIRLRPRLFNGSERNVSCDPKTFKGGLVVAPRGVEPLSSGNEPLILPLEDSAIRDCYYCGAIPFETLHFIYRRASLPQE